MEGMSGEERLAILLYREFSESKFAASWMSVRSYKKSSFGEWLAREMKHPFEGEDRRVILLCQEFSEGKFESARIPDLSCAEESGFHEWLARELKRPVEDYEREAMPELVEIYRRVVGAEAADGD